MLPRLGFSATTTRNLNENTQPGRPVGLPVVADDGDGDKRTYKLVAVTPGDDASEAAAAKFDINASTGQILTKGSLNHEDDDATTGCAYDDTANPTTCTYTVVVVVRDGLDANGNKEASETTADDNITVTITVKDVLEPPSVPTVVLRSPQDVTTLEVRWYTTNTGPAVTQYNLRYRQGSGTWSDDNCGSEDDDNCTNITAGTTSTTIMVLDENTLYSVQMQAVNAEGTTAWSPTTSQRTNRNKADDTVNNEPTFNLPLPTLTVEESHERSAQNVGSVGASDQEGDSPTYSLEGPNRNLFTIDSTGLIKTRSGLNFEDEASYKVLVKVADRGGASIFGEFTITILDKDEPPSVPSAPRVTATADSGKGLDVTWSEPGNTGPDIIDYDIQYREVGDTEDDWIDWTHGTNADDTGDVTADTGDKTTKTTIAGLNPRTPYEVEVRATNGEGTSGWSPAGRGTTAASNLRPTFDVTTPRMILSVDENTGSGQSVGSPVAATDNDGNRLTYSLEGPGKDSFSIVSSSGQIRTKSTLDYEERSSYSVTVKVDDGQKKENSGTAKSVTIEVADVNELPFVPKAPTVAGVPGSTSSVKVTWDEPANRGPAIIDYDVQYGMAGTGGFSELVHQGADMSAIITGLTAGTRYEVRVRARSPEGVTDYSRSGTGSPNPDVANRNPVFSSRAHTFSVDENTAAGDPIGNPVSATDADDDPLLYELEGTDAASFDIDRGSGQIRTSTALNHEKKSRYSVTVRARDGRGGTSTASVTINVAGPSRAAVHAAVADGGAGIEHERAG